MGKNIAVWNISDFPAYVHDSTLRRQATQLKKKMGKGLEQTLLQGGHTEGPETYERMLSITSHQRHTN